MFDLERIEVLRVRRNPWLERDRWSINFITKAPEDHFSADIEGAYGTYATARAQGHVNLVSEAPRSGRLYRLGERWIHETRSMTGDLPRSGSGG
jgi:hypothetical protein